MEQQLKPTYDINVDLSRAEVRFSIGGFWNRSEMSDFLDEVNRQAMPLVKDRRKMRALGDMRNFTAQDRETGDAIRNHLLGAKDVGLERIAIVTPSALVRLQYRRLSEGLEVEFFDDDTSALTWLRSVA